MIECKICNARYEKACSLGTHLWKTHGLKPQELGFTMDGQSEPGYFYVVDGIRKSRMNYQKKKLLETSTQPEIDETKTEHEIMNERGYFCIYDCGNYRYVWTRS